jgi:putative phosphoesterase
MRIAAVSDVHGNLTALEAVIKDIRRVGADIIVNGGDLVGSGARPAEVVDLVAALEWPGIIGNTDEVLWKPQPLHDLAERLPALKPTWDLVLDDVARTRSLIGDDRMQWLRKMPGQWTGHGLSIVHATPGDTWKAPGPSSPDEELASAYAALPSPVVVYGHIHVPFIRQLGNCVVANSGSVGMPYDGDRRASYLIIDNGHPTIQRVEYDIDGEVEALAARKHPHADWLAAILRSGRYVPPSFNS